MKNKIVVFFVCILVMIIAFSPSLPGEIQVEQTSSLPTLINPLIVSILENISESLVIENINELSSLGPRVTGSQKCDIAAKNIYQHFEQAGLKVRYQNWTRDALSGSNIEATLQGFDKHSTKKYIICGHYDTVEESPGADDNAAGISAVLIAADVLSNYAFNDTIRFVAFSGEELGWWGSDEYVKEAVKHFDNIAGVLNMDMMGYAATEDDANKMKVHDFKRSSWITNFTTSICTEYSPYINLQVVPSGVYYGSDHVPFDLAGYPAIWYWEYQLNPTYHTKNDILENMNPSYATKVIKLGVATLAMLAEPILDAPLKPNQPSGETSGNIGQEYSYTTSTTDPNEDQVFYLWDWSDGNNSEWLGPSNSGVTYEAKHTWNTKDNYNIKVKAKDVNGKESQWSDPLPITMPYSYNPMHQFFEWLFEQFPNAFPILQHLLGY